MSKVTVPTAFKPRKDLNSLGAIIPKDVLPIFRLRPLLPGEDPRAYDAILIRIAHDVKPQDIIEWIWVKDIVDLFWEAQRLRTIRANLIWVKMRTAGGKLRSDFVRRGPDIYAGPRPEDLISDYQGGYPADYASYVKSTLDRNGLNEEALTTVSFIASLPELQSIDSMLTSVETRRDAVLREIERRRFATGQRLREASDAVILSIDDPGERS